jgi:hypothetical protein
MKSDALRSVMMVRVKEAFAKWRTFSDMPEADEDTAYDIRVAFKADMTNPIHYIEALHSMCAVAVPVARFGTEMVGIADEAAMASGQGVDDKGVRIDD